MKKGFTLIELIATVLILTTISIVIILGIKAVNEKEKEKKWSSIIDRITSAADVYLEKNSILKQEIYNTGIVKYILVSDLNDEGLLDENELTDPRDEVSVLEKDDLKEVKIYLNDDNALEIEYPITKNKYILFDSKTIYSFIGQEINCLNGVSVYNENNEKIGNEIIEKIEEKSKSYQVINNNIVIDKVGEYELIYHIGENRYMRKIKVIKVEDKYYDISGEYTHIVEATGTYKITASGSQGISGGKGGTVEGEILLTKGTILNLIIGGQEAKYGGGKGQSNGGDSTRVTLNGEIIMIGAGGGGGVSGTPGGEGNSTGGANQGSGAGSSGTNGSGGGASNDYSYICKCETCGGDCIKKCQTTRVCTFRRKEDDSCHKWGSETSCWCVDYSDTYSCNCKTCTKTSLSGNGGTNLISSSFINITKTNGNNFGTGKIIIEFLR